MVTILDRASCPILDTRWTRDADKRRKTTATLTPQKAASEQENHKNRQTLRNNETTPV